MSEQCVNYEDMLYFERRLTEIVAHMEPKARRWRIAFVTIFVLTAYGAYFWIVDPSIRSVTFLESLMNHPLFTTSLLVLLTLIFVFGIHKKVVSPRIIVQRMRVALADFSLSCDDKGKLIMMPPLGSPAAKPSYLLDSSFARKPVPKPSPIGRRSRDNTTATRNESPITQMTPEEDEFIRQQFDGALELPGMILLALGITFMVVGGAIPYVFQYIEIHQRKSAVGFSLLVCLALCIANILRILFWFGEHFETPLLVQSVVMITCMILMLEISVRMNKKLVPPVQRTSVWRGDFFSAFWKWNDLSSFIFTLVIFTLIASIINSFFYTNKVYVSALGMVALLVEASLGLPQLIRNLQRRSVSGMSVKMVLMWLVGDVGKTVYFIVKQTPSQFYICSCLQITIDILILLQVLLYGNRTSGARIPTFSSTSTPKI